MELSPLKKEMFPSAHLLVQILMVTTKIMSVVTHNCPEQRHADEPKFTQELGFKDYVRFSHDIAILCCAEGYETITWYRQHNDMWQRFPPPPEGDDDTPEIEEKGQILRIFNAKLTDQTRYRCEVANGSKVIHHVTDLIVIECDPLARGPYPTSPFPENQTIFEYGGNVTLHCTGYFGCNESGDIQLAIWRIENDFNKSIEEISPRYKVDYFSSTQFVKEARLQITSVREDDTKRTFVCILSNDQFVHGQTNERVRITRKEIPKIPWLMIGLISGGCGLFLLLVISSVTSVRCLYGPQIRLYFSSRMSISTLRPKTVDRENYSYNLFIYHAVEDEETARDIKGKLVELHYKVYITADIKGNQNVMNIFFEESTKSAMVMFLYSDALRKDDLANFFVQSFVNERKGKDIMFLEVADYKPKDVMNWTQHAKDKNIKRDRNVDDGEAVNTVTENHNEVNRGAEPVAENEGPDGAENKEEKSDKKKDIADNLRFWKVLPRIKVPADKTNKRKMDNFLCSLQNKIPRFDDQKQQTNKIRDRNSSSQKPLLGSHRENEPVSPAGQNGNTAELSPTADDVFIYD